MRVSRAIGSVQQSKFRRLFFFSGTALFVVRLRVSVLKGILDALERGESCRLGN